MASGSRFLFTNGVVLRSGDAPPVTTFLETHPGGAYTTSRTHNNASFLLFWRRHLHRLADSARILRLSCGDSPSIWESTVGDAVSMVLPIAMRERCLGEEMAITALVTGDFDEVGAKGLLCGRAGLVKVHVHVGAYVPPLFGVGGNGAHLAVAGRGRDLAAAKCSSWVRLRKPLEKLRPPSVTELLLSNDGDQILEGSLTNFFVVCHKILLRIKMKLRENMCMVMRAHAHLKYKQHL